MVTEPQPIAPPDNFPVKWETPDDAKQFWQVDMMHWPHGVSPLQASMDLPAFIRGFNLAAQELCLPVKRVNFKIFNHYAYRTAEPWSTDEAEMGARMQQMQAKMMQHIPGLLDSGNDGYEPEGLPLGS